LRVSAYMAIVILVCSMGGLSLALGLSWAYADLDRDVEAYGAQSALLRDLSRLEEDLAQWAVTSDLVYGSGDTYLIDGAIRRGDAIQRTIMRIHADEVASAFFPTLDRIEYLVEANVDRLRSIVEIDPVERGDQLQQRLMDWDEESRAVFNVLLADRKSLEDDIARQLTRANARRDQLLYISLFSVIGYLIVVAIAWRWMVVTTSRPLLRLAREAEAALQQGRPLKTHVDGPLEAKELSASLQAFAGNLEEIVASRTRDVRGLIGLRDALFDAVPFPVVHRDIEDRFLECNAAFETFFGIRQIDLVGKRTTELPEAMQAILMSTNRPDSTTGTRECVIKDAHGNEKTVLFMETLAGGVDEGAGIVNVLVDITFRVEAGRRAQRLHELRMIEMNSMAAVLERREITDVVDQCLGSIGACINPTAVTLGVHDSEIIEGILDGRRQWLRASSIRDRRPLIENLAGMRTARQAALEKGEPVILREQDLQNDPSEIVRMIHQKGVRSLVILPVIIEERLVGTLTVDDEISREWHEDELLAVMSIIRGIGRAVERIRSEQQAVEFGRQQQTLLRELDHRVKNNLATILSMAEQTARETEFIEDFQESFSGRISSMARAHELLAASKWSGVDLRQSIEIVLAASGGTDQLSLEGPEVRLRPEIATPTSLVLNELATNARKYGSLSVESGRLEIRWKIEDGDLHVWWCEQGGPVVELPFNPGMGTRLITGFIDYQLRGSVQFNAQDGGLCCHLVIPLTPEASTRMS